MQTLKAIGGILATQESCMDIPSPAVLRTTDDGFVNLHNVADAADHLRVRAIFQRTDVAAEIKPIRHGPGRNTR